MNITRKKEVTKLELPIKRAKGSSGDISVTWSLFHTSDDSGMVWPHNGMIDMKEGQWNSSIHLNVASEDKELPEQVVWVQLDNSTGGAVLASRDQTQTKIVIGSNMKDVPNVAPRNMLWIIVGLSVGGALTVVLIFAVWCVVKKRRHRSERLVLCVYLSSCVHVSAYLRACVCVRACACVCVHCSRKTRIK